MKKPRFYTPPRNQGQIVIVSYAYVDGYVIRQRVDQSDRSVEYAVSRALPDDDGEYWSAAPKNEDWDPISREDVIRMMEEQ